MDHDADSKVETEYNDDDVFKVRDSHVALHTWAWRPYNEAEVTFKTIVGIFEVSSK